MPLSLLPQEAQGACFKEVLSLKNPKTNSFSLHRDSVSSTCALFLPTFTHFLSQEGLSELLRFLKHEPERLKCFRCASAVPSTSLQHTVL